MKRIPSLDGARAISAALVIFCHLTTYHPLPGFWRLDTGNLGVRVFFVISGFLITALMLQELQHTGRINLKRFYLRRFFRIVPAYWIFLATVAVLAPLGLTVTSPRELTSAFLYVSNYSVALRHSLVHTWSLSVEEQFYLLWPAALVLFGLRRARWGCITLLATAPVFRLLVADGHWPTSQFAFECVNDALATGCLLAILRDDLWELVAYRKFVCSPLPLVGIAIALYLMIPTHGAFVDKALGEPLLNFAIAATLDRYMRFPATALGSALNWRPLAWLGTISYSTYLWQEMFTFTALPLVAKLPLILFTAMASYYVIEQPFLRVRKYIARHSREEPAPARQTG